MIGFGKPEGTQYFSIGFKASAVVGTCPATAAAAAKHDSTHATGTKRAPGPACEHTTTTFKAGAFGNHTSNKLDSVGTNWQMDNLKILKSNGAGADCT